MSPLAWKLFLADLVWILAVAALAAPGLKAADPQIPANAQPAAPKAQPSSRFRPGRLLVQPRPNADLSRLNQTHASFSTRLKHQFAGIAHLQVLDLPPEADIPALIARYQRSGLVEFAEPDYWLYPAAAPNDTYFNSHQWYLENVGQFGGVPGADIHALEAWETVNSASNVLVAVVDTGVRYTHEDLADNMWVNPGEIAGNGLDDDANGFVDDVHGINSGTNNPAYRGDPIDKHGHGTMVAGVLGAVGNNAKGICGVAWKTKLMACRFYDAGGEASIADLITCLDYARVKGAKIINASTVTTEYSKSLSNALVSCRNAGVILVAPAGNDTTNTDVLPYYPACFRIDNIVAVAATTINNTLADFSNYGVRSIHLAAPGQKIHSTTWPTDSFYQTSPGGTSFSAPLVAGALALMKVRYPSETYRQLIDRLLDATDPLPTLAGKCTTGGMLNLAKALGPIKANFRASGTNGMVPLTLWFTNTSFCTAGNFLWDFGDGLTSTAASPTHTFTSAGNFNIRLTATSSSGGTSVKALAVSALPAPALRVLSVDPLNVRLTGPPSAKYIIQATVDFNAWFPVATNLADPAGALTFTVPTLSPAHRFFRALLTD